MEFAIAAHETMYFQKWIKLRNYLYKTVKPRDVQKGSLCDNRAAAQEE
jgi:hypothetical protein